MVNALVCIIVIVVILVGTKTIHSLNRIAQKLADIEEVFQLTKEFMKRCEHFKNADDSGCDIPWLIYNTYQEVMYFQEDFLMQMRTNVRRIAEKLGVKTELNRRNSEFDDYKLDDLGIPEELCKSLNAAEIQRVDQLIEMTENQVLQIKGINKEKLSLIKDILAEYGYRLSTSHTLSQPIRILNLKRCIKNTLYGAHIETIEDLTGVTKKDLEVIRNIGPIRAAIIEKEMEKKGFKLKENEEN